MFWSFHSIREIAFWLSQPEAIAAIGHRPAVKVDLISAASFSGMDWLGSKFDQRFSGNSMQLFSTSVNTGWELACNKLSKMPLQCVTAVEVRLCTTPYQPPTAETRLGLKHVHKHHSQFSLPSHQGTKNACIWQTMLQRSQHSTHLELIPFAQSLKSTESSHRVWQSTKNLFAKSVVSVFSASSHRFKGQGVCLRSTKTARTFSRTMARMMELVANGL